MIMTGKTLIKVALVGRPNVGKSALFNRISKKRISIVDEEEGVTRDRIYTEADFFGHPFELIDTGGISFHPGIAFYEEVKRQAEIAIEEADVIIMVVDSRPDIQKLDEQVAKILLQTKKPLVLAVNKIDHTSQEHRVHRVRGEGGSRDSPVGRAGGSREAHRGRYRGHQEMA